jgi:hypothetical protein
LAQLEDAFGCLIATYWPRRWDLRPLELESVPKEMPEVLWRQLVGTTVPVRHPSFLMDVETTGDLGVLSA